MTSSPSKNFDQARSAVTGKSGMQSSFVAMPGGSSSVPNPSMNFSDLAPPVAPSTAAPWGAAATPSAATSWGTAAAAPSAAAPSPAYAPQNLAAPIPDLSLQTTMPGYPLLGGSAGGQLQAAPPLQPLDYQNPNVFNPDTTPFSSPSTPQAMAPPPELPRAPPKPLHPKSFFDRFKQWSMSKKLSIALVVALLMVAVIVFFYSLFKQRSKSSPSGPSPDPHTPPSKDFVVHLAQGSSLQLQGLNAQPSNDLVAIKEDLAAIQTTLKSIDAEQKMEQSSGRTNNDKDEDWRDDWRRDDWESPIKKKGAAIQQAPTAAPTAAPAMKRLSKMVHYSADLAMQSPDQKAKPVPTDRWSTNSPTRFYGGAAHSCSSPIHSSEV